MTDKEIFISKWSNWWSLTRNGKELTEAFRKELESILTPIKPEQDGAKEDGMDVWDIVQGILGKCACATIYTTRQMIDPTCAWCEYHVDVMTAMDEYASLQVAKAVEEKEKYISQLEFAAAENFNRMTSLQSELSEKEAMVKELESQLNLAEIHISDIKTK